MGNLVMEMHLARLMHSETEMNLGILMQMRSHLVRVMHSQRQMDSHSLMG